MELHSRQGIVPADSRQPRTEGISTYRTNEEIVACFCSIIIKNNALDDSYPGGRWAFLEAHQGWHNEHIMVIYQYGEALHKVRADLNACGLTEGLDWLQIDEDKVYWSRDMFNFETDVAWLTGRYKKGNVYVRYRQSHDRTAQ
jgi:hypothetical protein